MFYHKKGLVRRVRIHPQYSGGKHDPLQKVRKMLTQDLRDHPFSTEFGYVVTRVAVEHIGDGYCLPQLGFIEYPVTFEAIVYYPIVGEVVDAVVETVTDTCILFRHVCVFGVVRSYCLNDNDYFKYEERDLVPENEKEQSGSFKVGLFRSETNSEKVIEKGTVVRVRITGRTLGGNGYFLIGSMSSDFLGPLEIATSTPELNAVSPSTSQERLEDILSTVGESEIPSMELLKMKRNISGDSDDDATSISSMSSVASLQPDP